MENSNTTPQQAIPISKSFMTAFCDKWDNYAIPPCWVDMRDEMAAWAYRYLSSPVGLRWVELKDGCEMPEIDEFVLWKRKDGNFMVREIDKDDYDWWNGLIKVDHRIDGSICTHWARIPDPSESPLPIEQEGWKEPVKYFFSQDGDGHWYMIPVDRRERWQNAGHLDMETDEGTARWEEGDWERYRTGGDISHIEFLPSPPTTKQ